MAKKIEKASRQQRESISPVNGTMGVFEEGKGANDNVIRQTTQEPPKGASGYGKGEGCREEEEIDGSSWSWGLCYPGARYGLRVLAGLCESAKGAAAAGTARATQ